MTWVWAVVLLNTVYIKEDSIFSFDIYVVVL